MACVASKAPRARKHPAEATRLLHWATREPALPRWLQASWFWSPVPISPLPHPLGLFGGCGRVLLLGRRGSGLALSHMALALFVSGIPKEKELTLALSCVFQSNWVQQLKMLSRMFLPLLSPPSAVAITCGGRQDQMPWTLGRKCRRVMGTAHLTAPSMSALLSISQGFSPLPHKNPTNEPLKPSFLQSQKKQSLPESRDSPQTS